jgi:hypothetical protein
MPSTRRSSLRKLKSSRTCSGLLSAKTVVFVLTRKPRRFASRMAATAL